MRTVLTIRLKEKMGTAQIEKREEELLELCFSKLRKIPGLFILGDNDQKRIGVISFGIKGAYYNLIVRLLNDRFGIQVRGGWSCTSTYGHHLFDIDSESSKDMIRNIENKNLTDKHGWVRLSFHPITTNDELIFICEAIKQVAEKFEERCTDY